MKGVIIALLLLLAVAIFSVGFYYGKQTKQTVIRSYTEEDWYIEKIRNYAVPEEDKKIEVPEIPHKKPNPDLQPKTFKEE